MKRISKNRKESLAKLDVAKPYSLSEACGLVKEVSTTRFDASVDLAVRLGVDPRKANQMVRGTVALPHGTGKDVRVLVLCNPDKEAEAVEAGADFVSLFYNRIRDVGYDAKVVVQNVCSLFKQWGNPAQVIVGSIRHMYDVNEAFLAGADIVTIPPKFFPQLSAHPKTDEAVSQFISDFQNWTQAE